MQTLADMSSKMTTMLHQQHKVGANIEGDHHTARKGHFIFLPDISQTVGHPEIFKENKKFKKTKNPKTFKISEIQKNKINKVDKVNKVNMRV